MKLKTLSVRGFRAHEETYVEFAPKINLIHGPNGAGKTNLLEAVHYLCLTKSFESASDAYVLRRGAPYFEVVGSFEGSTGREVKVRIAYVPEEGKRAFINDAPTERLADVVGRIPIVALTPGDKALTAGGPEERRRFMNSTMSQAHRVYLDDLMKYRRALRQRNALLMQAKRTNTRVVGTLDAWNEEVIDLGARIVMARLQFEGEFRGHLERALDMFEDIHEKTTLDYVPGITLNGQGSSTKDVEENFRASLDGVRSQEIRRGRTLIGPHRDEIVFKLDGMEVRKYASQGQHRTIGMALKLATYYYLEERVEEQPIILLDDVFGDLDPTRRRTFMRILRTDHVGQSIITAAGRRGFEGVGALHPPENRSILVENGAIRPSSTDYEPESATK